MKEAHQRKLRYWQGNSSGIEAIYEGSALALVVYIAMRVKVSRQSMKEAHAIFDDPQVALGIVSRQSMKEAHGYSIRKKQWITGIEAIYEGSAPVSQTDDPGFCVGIEAIYEGSALGQARPLESKIR